jgi:hypothetical protein
LSLLSHINIKSKFAHGIHGTWDLKVDFLKIHKAMDLASNAYNAISVNLLGIVLFVEYLHDFYYKITT